MCAPVVSHPRYSDCLSCLIIVLYSASTNFLLYTLLSETYFLLIYSNSKSFIFIYTIYNSLGLLYWS